ncbi:hypothetical protein GOP47_0028428 [Adiantum capillus-veneris]|nr:hypothetical protein GOP47_0028428 [Adiantum capillus-veneris]
MPHGGAPPHIPQWVSHDAIASTRQIPSSSPFSSFASPCPPLPRSAHRQLLVLARSLRLPYAAVLPLPGWS